MRHGRVSDDGTARLALPLAVLGVLVAAGAPTLVDMLRGPDHMWQFEEVVKAAGVAAGCGLAALALARPFAVEWARKVTRLTCEEFVRQLHASAQDEPQAFATAILAGLAANPVGHRAIIDELYREALSERARQAQELSAVKNEVSNIQRTIDGRLAAFSEAVDRLTKTMDKMADAIGEQGADIAHVRGRVDAWDGIEQRRRDSPPIRGGRRGNDPRTPETK